MKKILIVMVTFSLFTSCKKEENQARINGNGENLIISEKDSLLQNDTILTDVPQDLSLQKTDDGSYTFRYNLKKGETYPFLLKVNMVQSMSDGRQTQKLTNSRTTEMAYFVEDVTPNSFKIKATFKSFSEDFNSPEGENLSYNTNSPQPKDKDIAQN